MVGGGSVVLCLLTIVVPVRAVGQDSVVYHVVPSSRFDVKTGKSGLFGFAALRRIAI